MAHSLHDAACGLFRILGPSGMMAYLTYMGERLLPTRRLLKPTGSIYLHCDPTASHYLAHQPEDYPSRLALAQVKGGAYTASGFRDFQRVMDRDKAALGC